MKHSKTFLGFTTFFLILAAFAATKAKWKCVPAAYITALGSCIQDPNQIGSVVGTIRLKTVIPGVGTYFLSTALCVKPLFKCGEDN
jgi:hypothetical protein